MPVNTLVVMEWFYPQLEKPQEEADRGHQQAAGEPYDIRLFLLGLVSLFGNVYLCTHCKLSDLIYLILTYLGHHRVFLKIILVYLEGLR